MTPQDVLDKYKTPYRFAQQTPFCKSTLIFWLKQGFISLKSQYTLEALTNGELQVEKALDKRPEGRK